jgi:hypothetical protein
MLQQLPPAALMQLSKYDRITTYLFRHLTQGHSAETLPDQLDFDQDDVRAAMRRAVAENVIDKEVDNVSDIKYTYDARRPFPAEVEQCGPITWLQRGKGRYKLQRTQRKNLIDFEAELPQQPVLESISDQTPPFIAALLGNDEQAVFTRVRNADLLTHFLGFKVWPIQGHHRTTVSYGQIEIDEVQAGITTGGARTLVPTSGKGGQDKLSWSQALNLNTYAAEKPPTTGLAVRSLGLWRDHLNTVWIVEFSPETHIDLIRIVNVRRFKFV